MARAIIIGFIGLCLLAIPTMLWAQVAVERDIPYVDGSADPKHRLDIYIPTQTRPAPVLFWIHGGALTSGDRADTDNPPVGQRFASAGFVTVVISYRLSPGVSHPAHMQDAAKAFAWTFRNISKHGGNPEQMFVAGHSAGVFKLQDDCCKLWIAKTPRPVQSTGRSLGFGASELANLQNEACFGGGKEC